MKRIRLGLEIVFDPQEQNDHPILWDWTKLLDLGPNESARVVNIIEEKELT